MLMVPLQQVPNQSLNIVLNGQACALNVYALNADDILFYSEDALINMYVDLYVDSALIEGGMIGLPAVRMVRDSYLGFSGDLIWTDTQPDAVLGSMAPQYQGIGARWQLLYLFPTELSPLDV